jgi:hypothetical protein
MNMRHLLGSFFALLPFIPSIVLAQATLNTYIIEFGLFLNRFVVPMILALAFLFFVYNAVRFFVIGGASSESQEKAKTLALWGVLAFVFILSIWGLTNVLVAAFGVGGNQKICPDYYLNCN